MGVPGLPEMPVAIVCRGVQYRLLPPASLLLTRSPTAPAPHIHTHLHTSSHISTHPHSPPYDKCGLIKPTDGESDGQGGIYPAKSDKANPRPGKLNAGVNFYNFYKGQSHMEYEQESYVSIILYPLYTLYTPLSPYMHLCTPAMHVYTPHIHLTP